MKTMQTQPFFAALALIAAILLAACAPLLDDSAQGNLRIVLGGGARALSPQTIASFSYKLDFSGPGGENFSRALEPGTRAITLNLALGNWTIGVQAFNGAGVLYGRGEMTVLVGPGANEAPVSMTFSPAWHAAPWGNDSNPGSEAAPFATMDAALSAVQAAYAAPDWPGKGTANAAPAHIVVSGTITAGAGANGMVDITDTPPPPYRSYPPVILEGTGTLDANNANRVLYIRNADVTLGGNLTLTRGVMPSGSGGGVYVAAGGIFTMTGGAISNNSANILNGGGVGVDSSGTFTMTGGTISNNTVFGTSGGGGVGVLGGTFTMTGGTISNNTASGANGGGVEIVSSGAFTMTGGTISGNSASGSGGGVYVSSGNFTKTGGTIYGDKKEDTTPENINLQNKVTSGFGRAVFVASGAKKRNSTAGPGIDLNSSETPNWEP